MAMRWRHIDFRAESIEPVFNTSAQNLVINGVGLKTIRFDNSVAVAHADIQVRLEDYHNAGYGLQWSANWTPTNPANQGTVELETFVVSHNNSDPIQVGNGYSVVTDANGLAGARTWFTNYTWVTPGPLAYLAGGWVVFRLQRTFGANDTLSGTIEVINLTLRYRTEA